MRRGRQKANVNTFIVIGKNTLTNDRFIHSEIKTLIGEIGPIIHMLNKEQTRLSFEYVTKDYFNANKEYYLDVN